MITLEVHVNDKPLCRAGVGKRGVVSVIATWVNRPARDSRGDVVAGEYEERTFLSVGGLGHDRGADFHVRWA